MSTSVQNDFYLYLVNHVEEDGALEASCELPSTIDLSRNTYEISLVEVQLPRLWNNLYDSKITVISLDEPLNRVTITIPDEYYKDFDTVIRLVDKITRRAENKLNNKPLNVFFRLAKSESGRYFVVLGGRCAVKFSERIMYVLGLDRAYLANEEEEYESRISIKPDVDLWQYSLIAGCNIVPYSSIGDYSGRVLRVFSTRRGDISVVNLTEIYVPVVATMLNRVTVTIHNMKGHQLKFNSDEMIILVHLRKVIKAL